jgi:hypothetical protein
MQQRLRSRRRRQWASQRRRLRSACASHPPASIPIVPPPPLLHSTPSPLVSLLFVRIGRTPFLPPHSHPIPASCPQSASRQLQAVNEAHDRRDSLGSALVLLTVSDPLTAQPHPSQLKAQLEEAKKAGVPARLLEAVAARLERRPLESRAAQHQAAAERLRAARQRRELSATRYLQAVATSASLREAAKVRVATRRSLTRVGAFCSGAHICAHIWTSSDRAVFGPRQMASHVSLTNMAAAAEADAKLLEAPRPRLLPPSTTSKSSGGVSSSQIELSFRGDSYQGGVGVDGEVPSAIANAEEEELAMRDWKRLTALTSANEQARAAASEAEVRAWWMEPRTGT